MIRSIKALLCAIGLLWYAAPAQAVTTATVAGFSCAALAASCTGNFSASASSGSFILVVAVLNANTGSTFTIADSAGNSWPATTRFAYSSNGTIIIGCIPATTAGITSSNTMTLTASASTYAWTIQAYTVTGLASCSFVAGTAASGTWASGTPTAFATTPALSYNSEWVLGIIESASGATADTMGSYTGGFSVVGSLTNGSSNKPELFTAAQVLTSGTAVLGATPTSAAARGYNSLDVAFFITGASPICNHARLLLGVGC